MVIDCIITLLFSFQVPKSPIRMKNAIVSCLSSYSYTNNVISDSNEAMLDSPSQTSSNLIAHDNSFCMDGDFSNGHDQFGVQHSTVNTESPCSILVSGSTSILMPKQNLKEYPFQGETHLNFMPAQEDIFYQPWKSVSVQQSNINEIQLIRNARKSSVEAPDTSTCGLINSATNEGTQHKKRPLMRFQEKLPKIRKEKVATVRRSQKLTDKITALQKLVSPYGKTDTASVLLEASISIKALQDQIEDLFHMIPGQPTPNMRGEIGSDLQSRGLCLVPSVILKELDRRSPIHCHLQ